MKTERWRDMEARVSDPSVVAVSAPGERRWGYHQFPAISRLPDGRLLATFNDCPDRDDAYGAPGPARLSSDGGLTWHEEDLPDPLLSVAHSAVSEVGRGEYLCVPMSPSLDIKARHITLPNVSGTMSVYGEVLFHKLAECPPEVQAFMARVPSVRWTPGAGRWRREECAWETGDALVRTKTSDYVIARPYLDNRILRYGGALYYAEFHLQYLLPGGEHPRAYAAWCMRSEDNGATWRRHGLIAHDPTGAMMMGEPCLFPVADGNLACAIRCAHHRQMPMLIAYSADQGRTWSQTERLYDFGVMPQGLLLANGVAVLAFGRPGVRLMFSPDGLARRWVGPLTLVGGEAESVTDLSCGYTRLLPVADNGFLVVYSDFKHVGGDGRERKAILVRHITVSRLDGLP